MHTHIYSNERSLSCDSELQTACFTWAEQQWDKKTRLWAQSATHSPLLHTAVRTHTFTGRLTGIRSQAQRNRTRPWSLNLFVCFFSAGRWRRTLWCPNTHTHTATALRRSLWPRRVKESLLLCDNECSENRFTFHSNVPACATSGVTWQRIRQWYNSWQLWGNAYTLLFKSLGSVSFLLFFNFL